MSEWQKPFTKAEMEAARRATRDEAGILSDFSSMMRTLARSLPFATDALAAYYCVRDPATSARVKFILLAALAYFVMPLDTLPDFLPLLGFTDDAAVLAAAIHTVRGAITPSHREAAEAMIKQDVRE